jgi:hypothetical protein
MGKPFEDGARGPAAYDCLGLMLEVERRLGVELPAWASDVRELAGALAHWEQVTDPQPGDAILIDSDDPRWRFHIAVVESAGWMIHTRETTGAVRERYNSFPWQNRIRGFYRANGKHLHSAHRS